MKDTMNTRGRGTIEERGRSEGGHGGLGSRLGLPYPSLRLAWGLARAGGGIVRVRDARLLSSVRPPAPCRRRPGPTAQDLSGALGEDAEHGEVNPDSRRGREQLRDWRDRVGLALVGLDVGHVRAPC